MSLRWYGRLKKTLEGSEKEKGTHCFIREPFSSSCQRWLTPPLLVLLTLTKEINSGLNSAAFPLHCCLVLLAPLSLCEKQPGRTKPRHRWIEMSVYVWDYSRRGEPEPDTSIGDTNDKTSSSGDIQCLLTVFTVRRVETEAVCWCVSLC